MRKCAVPTIRSDTDDEAHERSPNYSETDAEEEEEEESQEYMDEPYTAGPSAEPVPNKGRRTYLRFKIGYRWSTNVPEQGGRMSQLAANYTCSLKGEALNAKKPLDS